MAQQSRVGTVATQIRRDGERLEVIYHGTPVVTVEPNGRITLRHNGWTTNTTKTRMNQASNQFNLGFYVYQEDYHWYVNVDGQIIDFDHDGLVIRNGRDYS